MEEVARATARLAGGKEAAARETAAAARARVAGGKEVAAMATAEVAMATAEAAMATAEAATEEVGSERVACVYAVSAYGARACAGRGCVMCSTKRSSGLLCQVGIQSNRGCSRNRRQDHRRTRMHSICEGCTGGCCSTPHISAGIFRR